MIGAHKATTTPILFLAAKTHPRVSENRPPHHEHHNSESPNEGRLPDAKQVVVQKSLKMQHEPCSVTSGTKCDGQPTGLLRKFQLETLEMHWIKPNEERLQHNRWPMMVEQPLNARMVVEEIKIGLWVETCDGLVKGFVKSEGLKKIIKELMEGEKGKR
ncbi:hypothetical protein Tco_0568605 [Tanacetum coccineum]